MTSAEWREVDEALDQLESMLPEQPTTEELQAIAKRLHEIAGMAEEAAA